MKFQGCLSIGELSKSTGIKVVTIRYYEQIRLLPVPARTEGNYRMYKDEHVARLRFIRRCRDLGFTLDEVRDLLQLSEQGGKQCAGIDRIAEKHLNEINQKIADLRTLAGELRRINRSCSGTGAVEDCRILQALSPAAGRG
jgi:DNA-binding transcriptional MerR regulator